MQNVILKKQHVEKKRKQFLLFLIAMLSMMSLQAQCPPVNVPYTENFESAVIPDLPACTSIQNLSSTISRNWETRDGDSRGFTGQYLRCPYSSVFDANVWFFTRGINLVANTAYKISYDCGSSFNGNEEESLKIAYGTNASAATMTFPLADHPAITHGKTTYTVNFMPATSGVYYFGFNAYSRMDQASLNLDNIVIEAVTSTSGPTITNFTSSTNCGQSTVLTINGTNLSNATVKIGGTPITLTTNTASQIRATILTAMSGPVVVTTNGGTATSTSNFTFMLAPALTLSGTTSSICAGTASNPVTITTGASGYTAYSWTPSTDVTGNSTSGWVFNPAANTSYVLNASNPATGCTNSVNYAIVVTPSPATPVITASSALAMCEGSNLVLTSSATSGNVWSTNVATNSITVTTGGSYTVTVTQNGCSTISAPVVVTVTTKPVAAASLTGNVTITATPAGQTYQWMNCTTNVPVSGATGATFTAPVNGSYKVIVTNAGGCKDTSTCVNVSKVGLDENNMDIGVSLYPNPIEGNVYLNMTETEKADVTVLDAQGKVVFDNEQHPGWYCD